MTATLLPNAKQQFLDSNGVSLAGGAVYFYIPATTTFKNTWQDAGQVTLNTNPVLLDAAGEAIIYGDGVYRQVVKDAFGTTIWDQLTTSYAPGASQYFQAPGTGGLQQPVQSKLQQRLNVADYDNFADASAYVASVGGVLYGTSIADSVSMQALPPTNVLFSWEGYGGKTGYFSYTGGDLEAQTIKASHLRYNNDVANIAIATSVIHTIAAGGTVNGPQRAEYAQIISMWKEGFGTTGAKGGEMDALSIVLRQDQRDGVQADGCGILINAQFLDNAGFVGGIEGQTTKLSKASSTIINNMDYQIGCMDHVSNSNIIYYGNLLVGAGSYGLRLDSNSSIGAGFGAFISTTDNGREIFRVAGAGVVTMRANTGGGTSSSIRTDATGNFTVLNDAQTQNLFVLTQAGAGSVLASFSVGTFLRLTPQAADPAVQQGIIFQRASTGKFIVSEDGASFRTIQTV